MNSRIDFCITQMKKTGHAAKPKNTRISGPEKMCIGSSPGL